MKSPLFIKIKLPENKPFDIVKVNKPHFVVPWHFHPEIELMLVTKGRGTRFVGDSIEFFEPMDLVLLGPDLAHVWKNSEEHYSENTEYEAECIYILFREDSFGKTFFHIPELAKVQEMLVKSRRGIKFCGRTKKDVALKIGRALNQSGIEQFNTLLDILHQMSLSQETELLASIGYNHKVEISDMHRLNGVLDFLMKNFREEIKLEQVAEIANMSATSFCRYFKSRTNKTVLQFLNEIRIGHAHKLLIETQLNMDQISYESGYKNVSTFYEKFQKITGKSPYKYRKEHNERFFGLHASSVIEIK